VAHPRKPKLCVELQPRNTCTTLRSHIEGVKVKLHAFLTSVSYYRHAPIAFPRGKGFLYPMDLNLGGHSSGKRGSP
jgi:hypothetical protein